MSTKEIIVTGITAARVIAARCQRPLLSCVIIPGNPGACGYYRTFVDALFQSSGRTINVFAVSHAGHMPVKEPSGRESPTNREWFNLAEQVDHHISVLSQIVPEGEKVALVGHSLGSWLITRILPQLTNYDVVKIVQLFPALCHIGKSPNGRVLSPYFGSYQWVPLLLLFFIKLLPNFLTDFIISLHLSGTPAKYRSQMVDVTKQLLSSSVAKNCLSLANEEMRTITELDLDVLQAFNSKISYICAVDDGWFPLKFVKELQEKIPAADVELVTTIKHAFVVEKSEEVASMVWKRLEISCQT